jgi:hypothetical protein
LPFPAQEHDAAAFTFFCFGFPTTAAIAGTATVAFLIKSRRVSVTFLDMEVSFVKGIVNNQNRNHKEAVQFISNQRTIITVFSQNCQVNTKDGQSIRKVVKEMTRKDGIEFFLLSIKPPRSNEQYILFT